MFSSLSACILVLSCFPFNSRVFVTSQTLAGSYSLSSGTTYSSGPPTYTCQAACAFIFGGTSSQYYGSLYSTSISHTCYVSGYAVGCITASETYSVCTYYNTPNCYSAYVADNCGASINYCWSITNPSPFPSAAPTPIPTIKPTHHPTSQPSIQPSSFPTNPTAQPSFQPTTCPTVRPTSQPSKQPTYQPSRMPTRHPSMQPSSFPTSQPSNHPSIQPTSFPSMQPSTQPTLQPSHQPTSQPTLQPSHQPTSQPSSLPSSQPSSLPTMQPSTRPSSQPSSRPSAQPSTPPSTQPSSFPSRHPSAQPSIFPSSQPSMRPSIQPSSNPSKHPSNRPSSQPSVFPSSQPSVFPTDQPTNYPSAQPSSPPSDIPSAQPTEQPSTAPSQQPSAQPSSQPSCEPSGQTTQYPSSNPSSQPSCVPSKQPSEQPSSFPSQQPTVAPSAMPSQQPSSMPTSRPSQQPSSLPSLQPYAAPSVQPSLQPTSQPSVLAAAAKVKSMNITAHSSQLIVVAYLDVNNRYSGTVYCVAIRNETVYYDDKINITSVAQVSSAGFYSTFAPYDPSTTVTISGLNAVTRYGVYCFVTSNALNDENSLSDVLATGTAATTACCITITYTNQPKYIYSDSSHYALTSSSSTIDTTKFIFSFALAASPKSASLVVKPMLTYTNGTAIASSLLQTSPSSITFPKQTSQLAGSFTLLAGSVTFGEEVKLALSLNGSIAASYASSTDVTVQMLSSSSSVPPPGFTQAWFGDAGKDMYLVFDSRTELAGLQLQTSWSCDFVFAFSGANVTTCTWLNYTTVRAVFPSFSNVSLLSVNGNVTLLGQKIRPYCDTTITTTTACAAYNYSVSQTTIIGTAKHPVSPQVVLQMPSSISACDNLTINAAGSIGFGGRTWSSATFIVSTLSQTVSTTAFQALLDSYGTNVMKVITVPKSLLVAGQTYSISLTLTNFFGLSATGVASVTVSRDSYAPKVSISGMSTIRMTASQTLSVASTAAFSSCLTKAQQLSLRLSYKWSLYSGSSYSTGALQSVTSSSVAASKYSLAAYTLTSGTTYILLLNVSVNSNSSSSSAVSLANSIATATISVGSGKVYPVIQDGSVRAVAANATITIDARKSYDQDSPTATLYYTWSCSIVSFDFFDENCSFIFSSSRQESGKVLVSGSAMNASLVYGLTTVVSAADGRSGSTTTVLQIADAAAPLTQIQQPVKRKFNYNQDLMLTGLLQSNLGALSDWSASIDGSSVVMNPASPQSKEFSPVLVQNTFPYSFVAGANSFAPGMKVTFQMTAAIVNNNATTSNLTARRLAGSTSGYSQIVLVANGPPTGGSVIVTPTSGNALSTVFVLEAVGFVDDDPADYPLSYTFTYQVSPTASPLTLQQATQLTSVSTQMPAGIQSYDYAVTMTVTAYDIYESGSSASTTATIVFNSNVDVSSYLNNNLANALQSGDTDVAFQVVNNVASVVNIVNCSSALKTYCDGLNRDPCASSPQTCGTCKSGFSGMVGNSNKKCLNSSLPFPTTCTVNNDCLYGLCTDGQCVAPQKTCPTLVTGSICSGSGTCLLQSLQGKTVTDCTITNGGCIARCVCNNGYSGVACELDAAAAAVRDSQRGVLCGAVSSINSASDPSSLGLSSLASSLSASFNPYETTTASTSSLCQSSLSSLVQLAGSGYLSSAVPDVATTLVSTTGSFINSQHTNSSSGFYENAVGNITSGISHSLADLQSAAIATDNIQVSVRRDLITDVENTTYTTPQTDAMSQYGTLTPSLSLGSSSYSSLDSGNGYAKLSLLSWGRNPYANSSFVESPVLRISSQSRGSLRSSNRGRKRKLLQRQLIEQRYFDDVPRLPVAFVFTVQFSTAQSFNFSANRSAAEMSAYNNNTFPSCTSYNVDTGSYGECDNCAPLSYTDYNVTIACYNIELIVTPAASNGVLGDDAAAVDDYTNFDQSFTASQFAAIFQDVGLVIASVLSTNPFNINVKQAKALLSFIGSLVVILVAGCIYFYRQDEKEYREYHQNLRSMLSKQQKEAVANAKKNKIVIAKKQGNSRESSVSRYNASRSARLLGVKQQQRAKYDFLAYAVPAVLNPQQSITEWFQALACNHDYLNFCLWGSTTKSRFGRWIQLFRSVLIALMVDTIFFQIFYGNDGTCETYVTKSTCLLPVNAATNQAKCAWSGNGDGTGSCALGSPPSNLVFTMILSLLTMLVALPLDIASGYFVDAYALRVPDWEGRYKNNGDELDQTKSQDNASPALTDIYVQQQEQEQKPMNRKLVELLKDCEEYEHLLEESTYLKTKDEIKVILAKVAQHFQQNELISIDGFSSEQYQAWEELKSARAQAIALYLNVNEEGSVMPLSILQRIRYGTHDQLMFSRVKKVRQKEQDLHEILDMAAEFGPEAMDITLLYSFVSEHLVSFHLWILTARLSLFDGFGLPTVHPAVWVCSWAVVAGLIIFLLYWILAWGVANGNAILRNWGLNYAISAIQDIFFVQIAKAFIFLSLSMNMLRPQLVAIRDHLQGIASAKLQGNLHSKQQLRKGQGRSAMASFSMVQYMSPSCRAARRPDMKECQLIVAMVPLLQRMNDLDVKHLAQVRLSIQRRGLVRGWIGVLILYLPLIYLFAGEFLADMSFEVIMPTLSSGVIMISGILSKIRAIYVAIPFIIIGAILMWRRLIAPLARQHYRKQIQRYAIEQDILIRRARMPPPALTISKLCASSWWIIINSYVLMPIARLIIAIDDLAQFIQRKKETYNTHHHHRSAATWRVMNTPLVLHRGSQVLATPMLATMTTSHLGQVAKMRVQSTEKVDNAAVIKQIPKRIRDLSLQQKLQNENATITASEPELTGLDKRTMQLNLLLFGASVDRSKGFVQAIEAAQETTKDSTDGKSTLISSSPAAQIYKSSFDASSLQVEAMLRSIMRLYRKSAALEGSPRAKKRQKGVDNMLSVTELSSAMTSMWANQHRLQPNPKLSVAEQREFMQAFYAWVMTQKPAAEAESGSVSSEAFYNWFRTRYSWLANRQLYR